MATKTVKAVPFLTGNQRKVLDALSDGPHTIRTVTQKLDDAENLRNRNRIRSIQWTYDRTHSTMRTLEDKELVRRAGTDSRGTIKWELTSNGKKALK